MVDVLKELMEQLDALPSEKTVVVQSGATTAGMSDDEIIDAIRRYEKRNTADWRQ